METLKDKYRDFVLENNHPCVMAQSLFKSDSYWLRNYGELGQPHGAGLLLEDLESFLREYSPEDRQFFSFIAVFDDISIGEEGFEKLMWQQLNLLHSLDPEPWDETVSIKPESPNFSFSLLGHAFYIIGMHPNSSRIARRSPRPTMVFNLHSQFEELRKMGAYEQLRNRIRRRDKQIQGNVNPMLADFGSISEARQYSGRRVGASWKCPFHSKH